MPTEPTDEEVNAGIDELAERAKRGIAGSSGHAWGAHAEVDRLATRLKAALNDKSAEPSPLRAEAAPTPQREAAAMTRAELIDWLVNWREAHKGSRSPENNRSNLETWTTADLRKRVAQIQAHESPRLPAAPAPWTRAEVQQTIDRIEALIDGMLRLTPKQHPREVAPIGLLRDTITKLRYLAQTLPATVPAPAPANEQE